ncbi:ATP-dependent 6-phosphofructokinase [Candidatus Neomarinimicrobiota bacterium]
MSQDNNFSINRLGEATYTSPLPSIHTVDDDERILYAIEYHRARQDMKAAGCDEPATMEVAGPRERLFFPHEEVTAGIVTCGGLCPGLNNVIRGLVMQLSYQYKVNRILGFRYGYRGIYVDSHPAPIDLTTRDVEPIHNLGGSILGSSRGDSVASRIVDGLQHHGIDMLFTIGGDGTIRGAMAIEEEVARRGLKIAILNIPKTIDNDIPFISKSFGFQTAFSEAVESIRCAHSEANGAPNGIGIVRVMGRESGFIAAYASLAQKDVNYTLVPESDFDMEGPKGLLTELESRLARSHHALLVVAEGAGQKYFKGGTENLDASGNVLPSDIGHYLKSRINEHFKTLQTEVNVKYIDPSYIIRSVPANPEDAIYCGLLAEHVVHAAMSGRTRMVIGRWNTRFVHLPMDIVHTGRKKIDPHGALWQSVLLSTGQPSLKN